MNYDEVTLEDIDTSGFYANPKNKGFVKELIKKHQAFDLKCQIPAEQVLTYIAVLYDPVSELRSKVEFYPMRKRVAAQIAGFKLNKSNRFSDEIEDMIVGQVDSVNAAIVQYCFLANNIFVVAHAAYTHMYYKVLEKSFRESDKDTAKMIDDLQTKLLNHEKLMFGGEEVNNMRKALYAATKKVELDFIPEAIVRAIEEGGDLNDWNPYPNDYVPNKLTYVGHSTPDV
jgi:hypothetical protein